MTELKWLALAIVCACAAAVLVWHLAGYMPRGFSFLYF